MRHKLVRPHHVYAAFKYAVYALLLLNVALFFLQDLHAAGVRAAGSQGALRIVELFAASIDTAAWVVLLLMFELETSFLPDSDLQRPLTRWLLHGSRAACAVVILHSWLGYMARLGSYLATEPFSGNACELQGLGWSLLEGFESFVPLDYRNCAALVPGQSFRLLGEQVLGDAATLLAAQRLAAVDVINAGTWILIVLVLEIDVRLQSRALLYGWASATGNALKALAYATLAGAAIYWAVYGDFLDVWDALLWLVAFAFIEMNLFQWQQESRGTGGTGGSNPA